MLFNSYLFILFFLPACLAGYFGLNHFGKSRAAMAFLLGMSLWFYGYFNLKYLAIIVASVLANYLFYRILGGGGEGRWRRLVLAVAVLLNVGVLFYFKYFDFFIENVNLVFKTNFLLRNLLLPLGISFFTFQQISFVVDAYRGEVGKYRFLEYALFVTFFPQLIAGPIVTHDELVPQLLDKSKKQFDWENFAKGIYIFSLGLAKKVLLADVFGNAANWGFSNVDLLDTTNGALTMLSYTIQIYFDFSGYCDMAIGIGKMLNIDLPLNFHSPYKALTITEFWKRWHMTLTRFLTKYVYIPLGGSRKGKARTYINVMAVFLVSGIWHGANYTFLLWGVFHGIFSVITRHWKRFFEEMHPALSWLVTFSFVNMTWVLFRADSIREAARLLNRIALLNFQPIRGEITSCFHLPEITFLLNRIPGVRLLERYPNFCLLAFFAAAFLLMLGSQNAYEKMEGFKPGLAKAILVPALLVWCIVSFSGISTFLYFNF